MLQEHIRIPVLHLGGSQDMPNDDGWNPERQKASASEKTKVLVVDDEAIIADTLAEILNQSGFRAEKAYNGQDALRLAQEFLPDVLLTDVLMPRVSGVDLAISLRKIQPEARILLFSGQAATVSVVDAARAKGFNFEVLPKPIPPDQLIHKLRRG